MKIILVDIEEAITKAYKTFCGDLEIVEIQKGSILSVKCDAVVSPANSYGFMDGGIDMVYSRHFGWGVQKLYRSFVRDLQQGE